MKKVYETPSVEIVKFQYRDQVVAASGASCVSTWINVGVDGCHTEPEWYENLNER